MVWFTADKIKKANRFKWDDGAFIPVSVFTFCSFFCLSWMIKEQLKEPFICKKCDKTHQERMEEERMSLATRNADDL